MHESALAKQIVGAVVARADAAPARRVRVVRGWVADTEALSHDSLGLHFAAHARGTVAEGARLEIRLVHVEARCGACARVYAPQHHLLLCPGCGGTEAVVLGRVGLGVDEIEVE